MNKLLVLMLVLGMASMASASYIGFDDNGNSGVNPLKVDINGERPGWQSWYFTSTWTGPTADTPLFNPDQDNSWEQPTSSLDVYRKNQGANANIGISRTWSGGWAGVQGTGDFSATTEGFGMNYVKLTIDGLAPDTDYKLFVWSFASSSVWADPTNPDSKFVAWSTTNPKTWLDQHVGLYPGIGDGTHDPNGYGPITGDGTDSNMPGARPDNYWGTGPSLWQLVLDRTSKVAEDGSDYLDTPVGRSSFYVSSDDNGNIVIYGWEDDTDWTGSMFMPLNGFEVIPEPATVALLGLGGLALLRNRRA